MSTQPSSITRPLPPAPGANLHPLAAAHLPYAPGPLRAEPRVTIRALSPANTRALPGTLMPESCEVILEPQVPVHLAQTLGVLGRGAGDPAYRALSREAGAERIWITARTPKHNFPAVLFVDRLPESSTGSPDSVVAALPSVHRLLMRPVRVHIWTSYDAADRQLVARHDVQALADEMTYWLGLHDHLEDFASLPTFGELPERIRTAWRANPGLRLSASGQLDRHVLNAIVEQRITQTEAFRALRWILYRHGEPAPVSGLPHQPEGLRVYPTARTLAAVPTWDWHRAGVDKSRYDAVRAYARSAPAIARVAGTGDVTALARALNTLRGVGPWSIAETLQRVYGHPDAISVGDYHLAHSVGELLSGRRTDDAGMISLLAPYSPHRQRVVRYMYASGFWKQRFGARMSIEDHRER